MRVGLQSADGGVEVVEVGAKACGLRADDGVQWWRPTGDTVLARRPGTKRALRVPVWTLRPTISHGWR